MTRTAMLRRGNLPSEPQPLFVVEEHRNGFIVGVLGGPQSLLMRGTREAALSDGAAYFQSHYRYDALTGGWRSK